MAALAIMATFATSAQAAFPDGAFVSNSADGRVYRIAGGAPLYVSAWSVFGGPQPTTTISPTQLAQLRTHPADGTLVSTRPEGGVYVAAGGALLYVSTWSAIGGARPVVEVDGWAHDNPENPHAHLRRHPENGTFLRASDGRVFRVAGGFPFYVPSWEVFGGVRPYVDVDAWVVANLGIHDSGLRKTPIDGTIVRGLPSGQVWQFSGGQRSPATGPSASGYVDVSDAAVLALPAVPAPAAPAPPTAQLAPKVVRAFTVAAAFRRGRLFQLRLRGVPRGARVTVRCLSRCGKRRGVGSVRQRRKGGRLRVELKRALRPSSRFSVRVAAKGRRARARTFEVAVGDILPRGTRCYEGRVRAACGRRSG